MAYSCAKSANRLRNSNALSPLNIEALFGDLFRSAPMGGGGESHFVPRWNIVESESAYEVSVDLPGMQSDEVDIQLQDGVLKISGEKKMELEDQEKKYHRVERWHGKFDRSIALPQDVDYDNVSAEFKDGVLTVAVPKSEKAQPRKIEIKS